MITTTVRMAGGSSQSIASLELRKGHAARSASNLAEVCIAITRARAARAIATRPGWPW
jgi:hypothetical protein